jgi:hypothetical protein
MLYRSDDSGGVMVGAARHLECPGHRSSGAFRRPPHIAHLKNIAFHPAQPDTLYVCIEQGDLLKSVDAGTQLGGR